MIPNTRLTMNRLVRFICADGSERPAVVVAVNESPERRVACLRVWLRKADDELPEFDITERLAGSAYREALKGNEPGLWRWPAGYGKQQTAKSIAIDQPPVEEGQSQVAS